MKSKSERENERAFYEYYTGSIGKKGSWIGFMLYLFAQWYDRQICNIFGHRYVNAGYANQETGCDDVFCVRCGKELFHHIYY